MQLETGNNVNNYQLSIRLILREPGDLEMYGGLWSARARFISRLRSL